jgi:antitoxin (DNA-binding transcriptional repressor) of toxin-antitoxin stability system
MQYTATEFRKNLFAALDRAIGGEPVEIAYKGSSVRLTPVNSSSKLARAKPQKILLCDPDAIVASDRKLNARMEAAWRKDWKNV